VTYHLGTGDKTPDYLGTGGNSRGEGRKGFSNFVKMKTLQKQRNCCAICFEDFTESRMPQFHHKNGNNSDNREKNCQVLHTDCHDKISREGNSERTPESNNEPIGSINHKWIDI